MARLVIYILILSNIAAFSLNQIYDTKRPQLHLQTTSNSNYLNVEIENSAQTSRGEKAATAAGAILGGMLGGPFGAMVCVDVLIVDSSDITWPSSNCTPTPYCSLVLESELHFAVKEQQELYVNPGLWKK